MIEDLCITSNCFLLLFFLNFGVDEAVDLSLFFFRQFSLEGCKANEKLLF